jgi:phosphoribosylanthranilate isomerase
MLATKVLASGITHLTDARYFAAWEVDYLAFPVGEGVTEGISWDYFHALREWVEVPAIAAELGTIDAAEAWAVTLKEQGVDHALVTHPAPAAAAKTFADAGIKMLLHVPVEGYQTVEDIEEALEEGTGAGAIVLDFEQGGITLADLEGGHPFGLAELDALLKKQPCLLQIGLGDTDPIAFKDAHPLVGYAVRGSSEEKVGYKSFDDLDDLFEGLEVFE